MHRCYPYCTDCGFDASQPGSGYLPKPGRKWWQIWKRVLCERCKGTGLIEVPRPTIVPPSQNPRNSDRILLLQARSLNSDLCAEKRILTDTIQSQGKTKRILMGQITELKKANEILVQQQEWIDNVPPKRHPDDERGWCAVMLNEKWRGDRLEAEIRELKKPTTVHAAAANAIREAFASGYAAGHNDTAEGTVCDSTEAGEEYLDELGHGELAIERGIE